MKATLEFKLPEEKEQFDYATNGKNLWYTCFELNMWLKMKIKNASDDTSKETIEAYEECKEMLISILLDKNIDLERV